MKRLFALMLIAVLLLTSGCSNSDPKGSEMPTEEGQNGQQENDETVTQSDYILIKESQYDKNGELSSTCEYSFLNDGKKSSETYTYYNSKSLSAELEKYGHSSDPFGFSVTYEYENGDYPTIGRISGKTIDGEQMGGYLAYTHDANGNVLTQWDYDENNTVEMVQKWSYYDNNEMQTYLIGFDANITRQFDEFSYEYNDAGQKISREIHHRYYSEDGKLKDEYTTVDTRYEYDSNDRLQKEYFGTNANNKSTTEYKYDRNGNLIKKTIYEDNVATRWTEYEYEKSTAFVTPVESELDNQKQSFVSAGQSVYFGTYEQDNQNYTTEEQIEWKVLEVEGSKALLLSTYILDARSFNNGTSVDDTTWDTSSIRTWLNATFYDAAFNSAEKRAIIIAHNSTAPNSSWGSYGGNPTDDNVFLLSIEEAERYFPNDDKSVITTATAYAYAQGCDMSMWERNNLGVGTKTFHSWTTMPDDYPGTDGTFAYWWLRSPGNCTDDAYGRKCIRSAYVKADDYPITLYGEFQSHKLGVRPAIWIDVSKLTETDILRKAVTPESSAQQEENRTQKANELIDEIRRGAEASSYESLYALSITLPTDKTTCFEEKWMCDHGFVGFFERTSQSVDVSLRCNNGANQGSLYEKGVFISETAVMLAVNGSNGKPVYVLFVYESDNAIHAYTLAHFGTDIPIAGTYIPERDYWDNFYNGTSSNQTDNSGNGTSSAGYSECETTGYATMKQYEGTGSTWGCFRIYDIAQNDEIYFEADWYRANGFGGVAKIVGDVAEFSITSGDEKVKGRFYLSGDDGVTLILDTSTMYCIEAGEFSYTFDSKIYTESSLAGYGEINHSLFLDFLKSEGKPAAELAWEYLGSPYEIFVISGEEFTNSFDFYKVINSDGTIEYYVVLPSDYDAGYGVYAVKNNGVLEKVWAP